MRAEIQPSLVRQPPWPGWCWRCRLTSPREGASIRATRAVIRGEHDETNRSKRRPVHAPRQRNRHHAARRRHGRRGWARSGGAARPTECRSAEFHALSRDPLGPRMRRPRGRRRLRGAHGGDSCTRSRRRRARRRGRLRRRRPNAAQRLVRVARRRRSRAAARHARRARCRGAHCRSTSIEDPAELDDSVELLFTDLTDWSIVDRHGYSPYRYNERGLVRAWAENCPATRQFLMDNYVRFARINGTHSGGGMSRARGAVCFLMLGDQTDMKKGTVTAEDAGQADPERSSAFAPVQMDNASRVVGPGAFSNGAALARPLEFSAREKGVKFMLNRAFDELVREQPSAGPNSRHRSELFAAPSSRDRRAHAKLLAERQRRREARRRAHPRAPRRGARVRRPCRQPRGSQHVPSGPARAVVPDERDRNARPARAGCERAQSRTQGRRQSRRHAAEPDPLLDRTTSRRASARAMPTSR